jgi:succinyl-diaminopimelate desuccinylase
LSRRPDSVALARTLIRCPSITPAEAGALGVLETALGEMGFTARRLRFSEPGTADVENLHARLGAAGPHFCFAGHVDVVPPGDRAAWAADPFAGEVIDGRLHGRGAVDMKGAIACFLAAVGIFIDRHGTAFGGSISLAISGDEEGPAVNGTPKLLAWMREHGQVPDHCLVGEPTCPESLGEALKIGRRGSMNTALVVRGRQGHVAYPQHADNPLPRLLRMLSAIAVEPLDEGTAYFEPSRPQITTVDVGNSAPNVIPSEARAGFNIRFNDRHSGESLQRWIRARCDDVGGDYDLRFEVTGEPFLCPPGRWTDLLVSAVEAVTGRRPRLDTGGGTSDARFIKNLCPVAEFGLISATAHRVDENVPVADLETLTEVYRTMLERYFTDPP